jgi:predicted amidohydrolase YtcJ
LPDAAAIMEKLKARAAEVPPNTWIVGQGTFGQPMPTSEELSRAIPNHPVVVRWSMHDYVSNRKALELANITKLTPDPQGGKIERGPDGEPTGLFRECFELFPIPYPAPDLKLALETTLRDHFLANGVTTVYELPASSQAFRFYQELHDEGRLPVRLQVGYTVAPALQPIIDLDALLATGIHTGMGDDWLRIGPIKLFVDGSGISAESYQRPGLVRRDQLELNNTVRRAHEAGWQLWLHAIGDRAQDMALTAYETALAVTPRHHRHRIEHIGTTLDTARFARMKKLGVTPVPTESGVNGLRNDAATNGAPARMPYKSMLAHGFRPAGNSDTGGTRTPDINPMRRLSWLVARINQRGEVVQPQEAVSLTDGLRILTLFGAWAGFEDASRGSVEVGKLADLVVLSDDLTTLPTDKISGVKVDLTVIDGALRYDRQAGGASTGSPSPSTVAAAPGQTAAAQANRFIGEWTLNVEKTRAAGNPRPVQNGRRTYQDRGAGTIVGRREGIGADGRPFLNYYAIKYDGLDYPYVVMGAQTIGEIAFKLPDPSTSTWTIKQDGKVTATGTSKVSPDGRTLTVTTVNLQGGQSVEIYDRRN